MSVVNEYPWHPLAIELAKKKLTLNEIYGRIHKSYPDPTFPAVSSYLYRNKTQWSDSVAPVKRNDKRRRFSYLKKFSIQAAKDLMYDKSYILTLKYAKTEEEIARIMATARERSYED